jgi:hypothetical protein
LKLALTVLSGAYSVVRLGPRAKVPRAKPGFWSVTRTSRELSIVCLTEEAPGARRREDGFRCLEVAGPFDVDVVGVLAALSAPLARARVPILAISTVDTDYLFLREEHLSAAVRAFRRAGHRVRVE